MCALYALDYEEPRGPRRSWPAVLRAGPGWRRRVARNVADPDPRRWLERFEELAQECVDIVREVDTGTVEYSFFVNAEGTEASVHERYRDSAAGLEHMRNIGRVMESLSEVCSMTGEVCGEPNAELREALTVAGVTIYSPLTSRLRVVL